MAPSKLGNKCLAGSACHRSGRNSGPPVVAALGDTGVQSHHLVEVQTEHVRRQSYEQVTLGGLLGVLAGNHGQQITHAMAQCLLELVGHTAHRVIVVQPTFHRGLLVSCPHNVDAAGHNSGRSTLCLTG
jgi:hypothetical protein